MTEADRTAWQSFQRRWSRLEPPLRPTQSVADRIAAEVKRHSARVLLLGATPELANIADDLTAIDWNAEVIGAIWPGNTPSRRAVLADWRTLPIGNGCFSAAIGDGSFNIASRANCERAMTSVVRTLAPGGRLAVRVFTRPDPGETMPEVHAAALAGTIKGFHAFKWRVAMAVACAAAHGEVTLAEIHAAFDAVFPDRASLSSASGWSLAQIGELDDYRGGAATYLFPTRSEIVGMLPAVLRNARFSECGGYELSERCPILVADHLP